MMKNLINSAENEYFEIPLFSSSSLRNNNVDRIWTLKHIFRVKRLQIQGSIGLDQRQKFIVIYRLLILTYHIKSDIHALKSNERF